MPLELMADLLCCKIKRLREWCTRVDELVTAPIVELGERIMQFQKYLDIFMQQSGIPELASTSIKQLQPPASGVQLRDPRRQSIDLRRLTAKAGDNPAPAVYESWKHAMDELQSVCRFIQRIEQSVTGELAEAGIPVTYLP